MNLTHEFLEEIVSCIASGMREENKRLQAALARDRHLYPEDASVSLLHLYHELYYEYIAARSLIENIRLPYGIKTQVRTSWDKSDGHPYDLGFFAGCNPEDLFCLGEIKTWWEAEKESDREIAEIVTDVIRLQDVPCASIQVVMSNSPPGCIDDNVTWLKSCLNLIDCHHFVDSSVSFLHRGTENRLLLIGFRIK